MKHAIAGWQTEHEHEIIFVQYINSWENYQITGVYGMKFSYVHVFLHETIE